MAEICISGILKLALCPASSMSHYIATIKPPPIQNPFTAAIIGIGIQFQFSIYQRRSTLDTSAIVSFSRTSFTSAPILNALVSPVKTTHLMSGFEPIYFKLCLNSRAKSRVISFILLLLFNLTIAT